MEQIIEGTWEEIAARADELRGKKLRVTVLEPPAKSRYDGMTLAEIFAGRTGVIDNLPPDLSERAEEYYSQIMDEKYPREDS